MNDSPSTSAHPAPIPPDDPERSLTHARPDEDENHLLDGAEGRVRARLGVPGGSGAAPVAAGQRRFCRRRQPFEVAALAGAPSAGFLSGRARKRRGLRCAASPGR